MAWSNAQASCKADGANMLSINSLDELVCSLYRHCFKSRFREFMIGVVFHIIYLTVWCALFNGAEKLSLMYLLKQWFCQIRTLPLFKYFYCTYIYIYSVTVISIVIFDTLVWFI